MPDTPRRIANPQVVPRTGIPAPKPGATAPAAVARTLAAAGIASAAQRREAEEMIRELLRIRSRVGGDFHEMGRVLAALLDRKLFVALGHASFGAMLEERKLMSPALATRLIAIWRTVPRQTAMALGPERTFEWLQLLRVQAGPGADPEDVRRLAGDAAEADGRPVAELTSRELIELRRRTLERQAAARGDPGTPEAHRVARALAQRLQRVGAEDARVAARYAAGGWRIRIDLDVAAARVMLGRIS